MFFERKITTMILVMTCMALFFAITACEEGDDFPFEDEANGATAVSAGESNTFYVAESSDLVHIKNNVDAIDVSDAFGDPTLYLMNTGGRGISMSCRCPSGYSGACTSTFSPGDPVANCEGTCNHEEIPGRSCDCGWFVGSFSPSRVFGLAL